MKKRQILSFILVSTLFFNTCIRAEATTTELSGLSGTDTSVGVDSNFTVLPELPEDLSGLIINIPAELTLGYDETDKYFKTSSSVSAYGDLSEDCMLDISVPRYITYTNTEGDKSFDAKVDFKRLTDLDNFQYWTSDELEASKTTLDERGISIQLNDVDIKDVGEYSSEVTFDISVKKFWDKDILTAQGYKPTSFSYSGNLGTFEFGSSSNYKNNTQIENLVSQDAAGIFEIPKYVKDSDGKPYILNGFGGGVLTNNVYLKKTSIPNSVTAINGYAFKGCTNLSSIEIPSSVKTLGSNAFLGCTSLKNIDLSNGLTTIGESAFSGCTGFSSFKIPNSVKKIDYSAFSGCTNLESIIIPDSVNTLGTRVFINNTSLHEVKLSQNLLLLDQEIFENCTSLETIEIPSCVRNISCNTFKNCTSLKSVTIPYSCIDIYAGASRGSFNGCTALTDINYKGAIDDAKKIKLGSKELSSIDWSGITDNTSNDYILGHATWHCTDGDFIPAES